MPSMVKNFFDVLMGGRHFNFLRVRTKFGPKEVIARKNEQYFACKVFPLVIEDDFDCFNHLIQSFCSLEEFLKLLVDNHLLDRVKVPILAVARPICEFFGNRYSSHYIYEIPGGVVDDNEEFTTGGLRECIEELQLHKSQVIAYAKLLEPSPFDSGTHVECTGMIVALIRGNVNPINRESIDPNESKLVPLSRLQSFVNQAREEHRMVEGYLELALSLLQQGLPR